PCARPPRHFAATAFATPGCRLRPANGLWPSRPTPRVAPPRPPPPPPPAPATHAPASPGRRGTAPARGTPGARPRSRGTSPPAGSPTGKVRPHPPAFPLPPLRRPLLCRLSPLLLRLGSLPHRHRRQSAASCLDCSVCLALRRIAIVASRANYYDSGTGVQSR